MKAYVATETWTGRLRAALFTTAEIHELKNGEAEGMSRPRRVALTHATVWVDAEDVTFSERSQSRKATCCLTPLA